MTARAVAAAAANQRVVTEAVQHSVAAGAFDVVGRQRHAQPALHHDPVESWLVVKLNFLGGHSIKEETSPTARDQLEVGTSSLARGLWRRELGESPLVNGFGKAPFEINCLGYRREDADRHSRSCCRPPQQV